MTRSGEPRFMSTDGAGASHSIWQNNIKQPPKDFEDNSGWKREREKEQQLTDL